MSPRKPVPSALFNGECRLLLALHAGRQPDASDEGWLFGMIGMGWIVSSRRGVALTPAGSDALARWLYRTCDGAWAVVPEQPIMFADEARVMLAIMRGGKYGAGLPIDCTNIVLDALWRRCWLDAYDNPTAAGRDALAAYLLRGWRP